MALSAELQRFTAPGSYLLTTDNSAIPSVAAPNGMRMLIGNSKQGPVGIPVYFNAGDWAGFVNTFGDIDRADERKGDFSKRSAKFMLNGGPIYYLNLRAFDDTIDKAGKQNLSVNSSISNGSALSVPYRSLFNRNQFWNIDPELLIEPTNTTQLLTFANVGNKKLSVFVRKSTKALSTLTFNEWYAALGRKMPDHVYGNDKVADWYVDVVVFANDFAIPAKNIANQSYGYLFDSTGVKKTVVNELGDTVDGLTQLSRIAASNYLTTFTGCLIPGFVDESNISNDVVNSINASVNTVGLVAAYNTSIIDAAAIWSADIDENDNPIYASNGQKKEIPVDIVGHNLLNISSDESFDIAAYSAAEVLTCSYALDTTIASIEQSVETSIDTDILASADATLIKIVNALYPATETVNGGNYTYTASTDTSIYAFDATKPLVGDKYVGKDGNASTVLAVNHVGTKTFLKGFGTYVLPVQPLAATAFDGGNDGFAATIPVALTAAILSNGKYSTGVYDTTVDTVTAPSTIVSTADISTHITGGDIIRVGNKYYTVDTVVTNTITVVEDFTGSAPVAAQAISVADSTAIANTTSLEFSTAGVTYVYNVTASTMSSVAVSIGTVLGFYSGGWLVYSEADYNYTTHVIFGKNTAGLYVYPTGHPLAGQPVVGSSTNANKPVHNPRATGTNYVYQLNVDGTNAVPSYPTTGYNPGTEVYITVAIGDLTAPELAAVKLAGGTVENVYTVKFDKPLAVNDNTTGVGDMTSYVSTGRSTKSVLVLDNSTEIIVHNNDNTVFKVKTLDQAVTNYKPLILNNYKARKEQFVDGSSTRQNEILDMLTNDLRSALKNRDLISYEYLVDGFKTYIEPSAKIQLSTICSERVTASAISSFPFMRDFQKSTNPYFYKSIGGDFDPTYIASGGNLNLPYTNTFSLPTTGNTFIYFYGNVEMNVAGESFYFPGAPLLSNNFAAKYNGGNIYDIIASKGVGVVSGSGIVGPEYVFKPSDVTGGNGDLDKLYPFGYNAIVRKNGILQAYGNRTAQNNINTSLSLIHVREIIRYFQLQMLALLDDYVFKFNTPENRLEAKTRADGITGPVVSAGALLSAENICNTSNNTAEIIENKLFILDTVIIANNGIEIAIHRTRIDSATNSATFELI